MLATFDSSSFIRERQVRMLLFVLALHLHPSSHYTYPFYESLLVPLLTAITSFPKSICTSNSSFYLLFAPSFRPSFVHSTPAHPHRNFTLDPYILYYFSVSSSVVFGAPVSLLAFFILICRDCRRFHSARIRPVLSFPLFGARFDVLLKSCSLQCAL